MSRKNPLTLPGIEPATFRLVGKNLNHCATAVPNQLSIYRNSMPTVQHGVEFLLIREKSHTPAGIRTAGRPVCSLDTIPIIDYAIPAPVIEKQVEEEILPQHILLLS